MKKYLATVLLGLIAVIASDSGLYTK